MNNSSVVDQLVEQVWEDVIYSPPCDNIAEVYARVNQFARMRACEYVLSNFQAARQLAGSPEICSARKLTGSIARTIVILTYYQMGARDTAELICDLSHMHAHT